LPVTLSRLVVHLPLTLPPANLAFIYTYDDGGTKSDVPESQVLKQLIVKSPSGKFIYTADYYRY